VCLLRGTDWIFIYNSTFCPHSVFMCFVWIWEQTAIISPYSVNWLVFVAETECVYCALRTGYLYIIHINFSASEGASEKLSNVTFCFVMSLRTGQRDPCWTDFSFHEIWWSGFLLITVDQSQVLLKSDGRKTLYMKSKFHLRYLVIYEIHARKTCEIDEVVI